MLEIQDLRLVAALAEAGSTVRASARLHMAQSAISRRLLGVEEKLGVRLFERTARGVSLTSAGRRLVTSGEILLTQLSELEDQLRHDQPAPPPLRLVSECYTAYRWLPAIQASLEQALGTAITIAIEHTHAPVEALVSDCVDVALLTTGKASKGLWQAPLFDDEIVFLMPSDHPLAKRDGLRASDLSGERLIVSSATPETERKWFLRQVFGTRIPPAPTLQFPLTEAVVDATRAGLGVAPMSEWVARKYIQPGELVVRSLRHTRLRRPWRIACRKETSAAAMKIAAALRCAPEVRASAISPMRV